MTIQPTASQLQDAILHASWETLRVALASVLDLHQPDLAWRMPAGVCPDCRDIGLVFQSDGTAKACHRHHSHCIACGSCTDHAGQLRCERDKGTDLRAIASVLASSGEADWGIAQERTTDAASRGET